MKFSEHYGLGKHQSQLDFIDISLEGDIPLYIDPTSFVSRTDDWSDYCHSLIISFFQNLIDLIRLADRNKAIDLLSKLSEPEETMLGVSKTGNKGRGIGAIQSAVLYDSLSRSRAVQTGMLQDLSDLSLFIPNIGMDKVSDITTNIIRGALIEYTQAQCELHEIPMQLVASGFYWDKSRKAWDQSQVELPVANNKKILLVPKFSARYTVCGDHSRFYDHEVLTFLKYYHLEAGDALVTVITSKHSERRDVFKTTLRQHYPKSKDFLADFCAEHPEVIDAFKARMQEASSKVPDINHENWDERELASFLIEQLSGIPSGRSNADNYHNLMIGILSFLFFPNLIYPEKEAPINQGRKRLDIKYTNGMESGFFFRSANNGALNASFIPIECKNYSKDPENPEFDQLIGRFHHSNGKLGMLIYRSTSNQQRIINRCRDAYHAGQGCILPVDDQLVECLLELIKEGRRDRIDPKLDEIFRMVTS